MNIFVEKNRVQILVYSRGLGYIFRPWGRLPPPLNDAPRGFYGLRPFLHVTWTLRKAYAQKKKIISSAFQILEKMGFPPP